MLKKIALLLSLIATPHTHAMNTPMEIEETNLTINRQGSLKEFVALLISLPTELQNAIAQLLTFDDIESEEEFITRTKTTIKKPVPKKYYYKNFTIPRDNHFPDMNEGYSFSGTLGAIAEFCPNEIHLALLLSGSNNLNIINTQNDRLLHTEKLNEKTPYKHIAISRGTHMVATLHEDWDIDTSDHDTEEMRYTITKLLTIKNITTQKTKSFKLPDYFEIPCKNRPTTTCAFKKEGTHIIVHGLKNHPTEHIVPNDPVQHHLIYPITMNGPYTGPVKKTLLHYLAYKAISQ